MNTGIDTGAVERLMHYDYRTVTRHGSFLRFFVEYSIPDGLFMGNLPAGAQAALDEWVAESIVGNAWAQEQVRALNESSNLAAPDDTEKGRTST